MRRRKFSETYFFSLSHGLSGSMCTSFPSNRTPLARFCITFDITVAAFLSLVENLSHKSKFSGIEIAGTKKPFFIYFILFYFILFIFYFILFYFILFYFILFYFLYIYFFYFFFT